MTVVPAKRRAEARRLTLLCAAVYFCSYLTRLDYGAVMVEMVRAEGFSRVDASAALTGLFITYGFGQLISGYLGDRVKPQLLIFFGLIACGLMNLLIPFCPSPAWMTVVWSVNGLAQAMMWPPLVRIMSQHMTESEYKVATVHVSWGSSLGTIVIYLMIPLLLKVSSWRGVFYCAAAVGMGMAAFWMARYGRVERTLPLQEQAAPADEPGDAGKSGGGLRALMPLLAIMMGVIICQGTLRDGITTWMPTYLADTYHMESGKSILTGVLLPLFGMVCYQIVLWMNRKLVKNELQCAAIIFGVGLVSLLALRLLHAHSFALSVLILAFAVASMHGVNLIMTCMTPKYLAGSGKISMISGLLNACTYIGSALSMYGVALIADRFGWTVTESLWCAVALLGTLCAAACVPKWGKLRKGQ
ncbi:MAG: MFS transporter [Clostridiales bacterium]|nr:MFS transporter [Clostridiales bacterium]MDY5469009.1 MFS transporter [Eubacteriales bacterium]